MDWTLLGIAPTKDQKAITAAYRGRLASVNPEDKPEEFKALRGAYEEALRLADEAEEPVVRDESPVGLWMERVQALYHDFPARIRPENWAELLADPVCVALDQRPQAEEALLRFFLEDYHLPQGVWLELDRVFSWTERREELYESYPRDFVDYVIMNGVRYPSTLPYELFLPGQNAADCDQYRHLYYQANRLEVEEQGPILEQMAALSEEHPYGHALGFRFLLKNGKAEQGREGLRKLAEAYPDDAVLLLNWAVQCAADENWAEGEKLTRHIMELEPDHRQAKRLLADCLAGQDRQEEAKDLIFELMHAAGGDRKEMAQLEQVIEELNESLIGRWEEKLAQNPQDGEIALELGWCYLQDGRSDDALRVCQSVDPNYEDQYDYHNLYAKVCYAREEMVEALEHMQALVAVLRAMKPDGTENTEKRLKRLPEMLPLEGSCLYALDRRDEGRALFEQALEMEPENPELLTHMARLLHADKNYGRAVEVLNKLTEVMPHSYHGYFLLAQSLYEMGRDRDAFAAVNRALELDGSDLGVYVLKMRILLRNGVWDEVRELVDFLHQSGITNDLSVMWCEAQLTEYAEEDKEKALERYQAIAKRLEDGEYLPWAAQVYFRITVLLAEQRDARKAKDRKELLAVLEKGLAQDPEDMGCLDYKAWLLDRDERTDEAIALYHKLEAMPRRSLNVERELARLYYKDLGKYADKALHYYQMLLDHEEDAELHFYAGFCRRYLADWAGAERNFLRERELAPDDVDAYRGLALVYEAMGRLDEALENAEKAIELRRDLEGDQSRYWFRKIQILRRMGRWEEAIRTVDEVTEKYGYESAERMKFDIYCQFGLWEQAQRHLDDWKKSKKKRNLQHGSQVKLDLYMGRYDQARAAIDQGEKGFNPTDYAFLRLSMAELDGDAEGQLQEWSRRREKAGEDTEYALMNLAQDYWWIGEVEQARQYAQQALAIQEEDLKELRKDDVLVRSHRCIMLAILGRMDEAQSELTEIRSMALCEHCDYCACKDADIYEANIEEIAGRYQRAMELYKAGMERWPDDIDFAAGLRRMQRKGIQA